MSYYSSVFSEAEFRKLGIKVEGADNADIIECIGSISEELEVKTRTKSCRGVVSKTRTKGTGNGTVTITGHIPYDTYVSVFNMDGDTSLIDGVAAHGTESLHPVVTLTALILDEDDNEKLKAYPTCTIQSNLTRSVTNGDDEIAELEIEFAVMPDDYGNGMYEAVVTDDFTIDAETWLSSFTPDMVHGV